MGLFSRKEPATDSTRRTRSSASEAHADDLRSRARRRLIGALALVVAAIIVVPMLIQAPPTEQPATPIVVPAIVPPTPDASLAANGLKDVDPAASGSIIDSPVPDAELDSTTGSPDVPMPEVAVKPEPAPAAKPETKVPHEVSKPKPVEKAEPKPKPERTDDGSVAIALLEGRKPVAPPKNQAAPTGNYVLQIAAYSTDKDAQGRRENLISSGVTNAYIETASSGGKTAYRLRVGPFPTREAAQAAQTRLRALGYNNSFISSK